MSSINLLRAIAFRLALLCMQLAAGCAHFDSSPLDTPYGVTPPGYVSQAFKDGTVSEGVAPAYGVADFVADTTVNLLGSMLRHAVAPAKKDEARATFARTVPVAHAAPIAHAAPVVRSSPPRRTHRESARSASVQHASKPVVQRHAEHKPSQSKPSGNKSSSRPERKKK